MTTTDNQKTTITYLDEKKAFKGITHFDEDYSLKGTTHFDEILFMEGMILIRGITLYKDISLDKGLPLKGKTLIREIAIENGKIFLKGTTYVLDNPSMEGKTLISLSDFKKAYPIDESDLLRCLV
ncbi:MAG: hypothetical protein KZQ90_14775 [Candidatus Thiodiazotropha sp. (ex Codakia rugifera)]|nr:hypothetical protein [Candidatus Thiodiazotropha sp. (ex Codakia rugifera)]